MLSRQRVTLLAAAALLLAACTSSHRAATPRVSPAPSSAVARSSPTAMSPTSQSPSHSQSQSESPSGAPKGSSSVADVPKPIWPTYHHDSARTGAIGNAPAISALKVAAAVTLDGAVYASPLVVRDAQGPLVIAATENNTLYALRNDGRVMWKRHVGAPVDGSTLPCGNIDPSGITGTPAYDPTSGLVFAVAFLQGHQHVLVAVDARSGAVAWSKPVDPPGSHPDVEQQRAALLVSGGKVWVAYGGLYGDCGPYHGYLLGISTSGQGDMTIYQVPSAREAGIWAPSGPAATANGHLFVSVGNGAQTDPSGKYDMSDSVIELDPSAHVVSFFAPSTWAQENSRDLDLGTTGPTILPDGKVFVAGKAGRAYVLSQGNLGGIGGNVPQIGLCTAFGGAAYSNGIVYVPCANGLRAVRADGTSLSPAWRATPAGSPVVGGGVVLSVSPSSGVLYALDPSSGAVKAQVALGDPTTRFATPAIGDDGHAYIGTEHGRLVVLATS